MKTRKLESRTPGSWIVKFIPFLLALACAHALAEDFRVGVVDIERILRESAPAMKAEKKIEKEFSARDQEIKKLAKQAKDLQIGRASCRERV